MTSSSNQALAGIRVLELATYIAGPFCATVLAEFGADVIKVELPGSGDPCRKYGVASAVPDASYMFLSEGRNKKSITLDLRTPEGLEIAKRLVADVDVVIENFQVGTLEDWGLGWTVLKEINPRLGLARITGYGQTGPLKDEPGFGRIGVAFGGLANLTGYHDRPPTSPGTATLADYIAGLFAANGVLVALRARDHYGIGQFVDIGLYEGIFRFLDEMVPLYGATGKVRQRSGPASANALPHSNFESSDGRWLSIACTTDKIFARLAAAMCHPEIAASGGKWETYALRRADETAVYDFVTRWAHAHTRDQILTACKDAQVPCGPIYSIDEIFADSHYHERGNLKTVRDSRIGELIVANVVPRLSETPGAVNSLGPTLGAHNEEIYGQRLGLSSDHLAALAKKHVI